MLRLNDNAFAGSEYGCSQIGMNPRCEYVLVLVLVLVLALAVVVPRVLVLGLVLAQVLVLARLLVVEIASYESHTCSHMLCSQGRWT